MGAHELIEIASGLALIPMALWFYPHCARVGLTSAKARRPAFVVAQIGTGAAVLAGILYILDAAGLAPVGTQLLGLGLIVAWVPAALAYLRPMWIVRATGGMLRG